MDGLFLMNIQDVFIFIEKHPFEEHFIIYFYKMEDINKKNTYISI